MSELRAFRGHAHGLVAAVAGASGGIGEAMAACLMRKYRVAALYLLARKPVSTRLRADPRVVHIEGDLLDEAQRGAAVAQVTASSGRLDLLVNACGLLHGAGAMPEKRLVEVRAANLEQSFRVNAVLPLLLAQSFGPLLRASTNAVYASLSARVGSIADNRSGGWHSYRASKAAHNMLLKNVALEWRIAQPSITVVMLQPGTVRTALSGPFLRGAARDAAFEPDFAAARLLEVSERVPRERSGVFLDWRGEEVPF